MAEIEDVVRSYFDALTRGDTDERAALSVGEVQTLAGWQEIVNNSLGSGITGNLNVSTLEVSAIEADEATVDFAGSVAYPDGDSLDLTGPVTVTKVDEGWKILDYFREGRSQVESVFTDVEGAQEKGDVRLEVIGADLRSNATLVMVRITNNKSHSVAASYTASIVVAGEQHDEGLPCADQVASKAATTACYVWQNLDLPLSTKAFRLIPKVVDDSVFEAFEYDFKVTLKS